MIATKSVPDCEDATSTISDELKRIGTPHAGRFADGLVGTALVTTKPRPTVEAIESVVASNTAMPSTVTRQRTVCVGVTEAE